MNPLLRDPCSSQSESELFRGYGITEKQTEAVYNPGTKMKKEKMVAKTDSDGGSHKKRVEMTTTLKAKSGAADGRICDDF